MPAQAIRIQLEAHSLKVNGREVDGATTLSFWSVSIISSTSPSSSPTPKQTVLSDTAEVSK